ncbi:phosphate-starvation-inducible PsiE family protein [Acinetobacter baumannii]
MKEKQLDPIKTFRAQWAVMTFYERFEQVIALALSAIIAVIIVVSLLQLISIVFSLLVIDAFNPLDHKVFQTVFGMIMTLLIAMEFKHSISRLTHLLALLGQIMLLFSLPALLWGTVAIQWPALLLLAVSPQLALLAQLGLSRVREFDARAHPTLAGIG